MTPSFHHHDLCLLNPAYESSLIDVLQDLEHLRKLNVSGTTPSAIFYELKGVFHMLESLSSARIEGNHTTLADYIDSSIEKRSSGSEQMREISNIELAMDYIDRSVVAGEALSEAFVRELHALTVDGLVGHEGDRTPGAYRTVQVSIQGSGHLPPDAAQVPQYMEALLAFVNTAHPAKYELMKVALAHHRFGWIHPFSNGNGRAVRLLTYALLIKYGFNVSAAGRLINPTAVFCNDREKYYRMLSLADGGDHASLEAWCEYVLTGILDELRKLDQLTDFDYLRRHILSPALSFLRERDSLTSDEVKILRQAIDSPNGIIRAADARSALPGLTSNQVTYRIKTLVNDRMLLPTHEGARQYTLCFRNNRLLRGVIHCLVREGFVPESVRFAPGERPN